MMKLRITEQYDRTKKKRKRIFWGITAGCLILALAVIIVLRAYELKNITISGTTHYTEEELKELLCTEPTDSISFLFYLRLKWQEPEGIPFIEAIETRLVDRNSVELVVHEKLVTGCVEQMGSYLYFDREGMVVESTRVRLEDVPLLTGLRFSRIVLKEKLQIQREGMFQTILNLARLIEKQELHVSEINFNSDYEVTLYVDGCEILLGQRENYDESMAVLKSVLASAEGRRLKIDMRYYEDGNGRITSVPLEEEDAVPEGM